MSLSLSETSVRDFLQQLHKQICQFAENLEEKARFIEENWSFRESGGGVTCILTAGQVMEKAGVNFSHIASHKLPEAATLKRPDLAHSPFQAMGVSAVFHPLNPYVPTSHFNVRFIQVGEVKPVWWFGGGFDLTPYYGFEEDCRHWHQMAKAACDPFGLAIYPKYKNWCDDYFYLPHRKETRGIGGLFFDDLNEWGFEPCFNFIKAVGEYYLKAYLPIVLKRKNQVYGEKERSFQTYRRGRYVEYNLLYDRGTLFGLQSGGRTESILMSLPPLVTWPYQWQLEPGSAEEKLFKEFLIKREWI